MPSIIAENNSKPRVLIPAGNHIARCYAMVQIGTIVEQTGIYKGKESHKIQLSWETPDERHDFGKGEQPFSISQEFTLSMHEKATLRKMLEGWRGKAFTDDEAKKFDVTKLLTKPCMLSVIHKTSGTGNAYAQIASVSSLPKGFECPPQENKTTLLSFDGFDRNVFDGLPEWLRKKIESSREYAAMLNPAHQVAGDEPSSNEDLPF